MPFPDPDYALAAAQRAIDLAVRHTVSHQPTQFSVKGDRDVVTDVDLGVEHLVRNHLRGSDPTVGFVGEEHGASGNQNTYWVLDPIDGTINFAHDSPLCAIALVHDHQPVLGITAIPFLEHRYWAVTGHGAYRDGDPIAVSTTLDLDEALIGMCDYRKRPRRHHPRQAVYQSGPAPNRPSPRSPSPGQHRTRPGLVVERRRHPRRQHPVRQPNLGHRLRGDHRSRSRRARPRCRRQPAFHPRPLHPGHNPRPRRGTRADDGHRPHHAVLAPAAVNDMTASRAAAPEHTDPEHPPLDHDTIPHDLLAELRAVHRAQPHALDGDLPQWGLAPLTGGRNNRAYRWSSPRGPACLKLYRTDKRDRARCKWTALRHLAEHGVAAASTAFWHDSHPELPALGMRFVPGLPITTLGTPSTALPALVTVLSRIRQVPLGPFTSLGRLDSASDFIRRITAWPEHLGRYPDEALTRELTALITAWHDRRDAAVLAEPAPLVFSHGDGNLDNWLWHDFISTIYALDWEFAGHSDAAYDAAELIEHPSARTIDDGLWLTLLPDLGVDDAHARRRFAAARRTVALRWLAVRWKRRHEHISAFEQQLHRTRILFGED
jgi:aminoglycoside phosphotransferase (APT) family kinase protein